MKPQLSPISSVALLVAILIVYVASYIGAFPLALKYPAVGPVLSVLYKPLSFAPWSVKNALFNQGLALSTYCGVPTSKTDGSLGYLVGMTQDDVIPQFFPSIVYTL